MQAYTIIPGVLVVVIIISSCKSGFKSYVPICNTGNELVECPDSVTSQQFAGIQKVFTYYRVPYKLEGGQIFYKRKIDRELLWNYTMKASDTSWLETH